MGPGLASMLVFILLILIWSVYIKRNIGEVAFIGMIVVSLFGGSLSSNTCLAEAGRQSFCSEELNMR